MKPEGAKRDQPCLRRAEHAGPHLLRLDAGERTRSDAWRACEELLRHEGEAVELLERFSAEPQPLGLLGEQ
jgi:hypothetical protein